MKKNIFITLCLITCMALCMSACSNMTATIPEPNESTAAWAAEKEDAQSTAETVTDKPDAEATEPASSAPAAESVDETTAEPDKTASAVQTPESTQPASSEKPTQTETPKAEETKPTAPPATPQPAEPEPTQPEPTEPKPTEPPAQSFDVSQYVSYAKDYGQSIGLALDSTAISSWDTPTEANARCIYLERDLKDLLDWYKASGFTAFWVWAESEGNNQFLIYVGYA